MSDELRIALRPRASYARLEGSPPYIPLYILFVSVLIGVCAAWSATGRVTVGLVASLSVSWAFVPLLHVSTAALLVASAPARRVSASRAVSLLLMGHVPWSTWLLVASTMTATGGYALYREALLLAIVPMVLTLRIVHAFVVEVLQAEGRGAIWRTLAHQAVTWAFAAIYIDRAVRLLPRLLGALS